MAEAFFSAADDLESRIEELEGRIDEDPTNAELHKELGNVFHLSRAYDLALAEYRTAIKLDPGYYPAVYNMGNSHYEKGEPLQAIICWQRALIIESDLEQAIYNIGFTYYRMGSEERDKEVSRRLFDDAIHFFQKALSMVPDHADTHLHLGLTFYELEKYDEAVRCYEKALEIEPEDPTVHYNLGNVFYEKGERDPSSYQRALEEYKAATKFDKKDLKSLNNIADCYLRIGRLKQARKQIQKVLDRFPDYLPAHCTLGEIFSREGNPQAAIGEFEMVLALDPEESGILHKYAGRHLIEEYSKTIAETPEDPDLRLRLGRAYKILGMAYNDPEYLARAIDELRQAAPAGAEAFVELSEVLLRLRRHEEALAAADAALERNPEDLAALSLKAEVFSRLGDRDRAVVVLRAIRKRTFS